VVTGTTGFRLPRRQHRAPPGSRSAAPSSAMPLLVSMAGASRLRRSLSGRGAHRHRAGDCRRGFRATRSCAADPARQQQPGRFQLPAGDRYAASIQASTSTACPPSSTVYTTRPRHPGTDRPGGPSAHSTTTPAKRPGQSGSPLTQQCRVMTGRRRPGSGPGATDPAAAGVEPAAVTWLRSVSDGPDRRPTPPATPESMTPRAEHPFDCLGRQPAAPSRCRPHLPAPEQSANRWCVQARRCRPPGASDPGQGPE